jgi:hypothetical protein
MRSMWFHPLQRFLRKVPIGACFVVCMSSIFCFTFINPLSVVHAAALPAHIPTVNCNTSASADPGPQSLLVVLLDRSGSLIYEPGATDPNGYSTSVTKALADLWVGQMAVIPFSGDTTSLPILGPSTLGDRSALKDAIQATAAHIGGNTPLAPAMREALNLLQQKDNPVGSRVIIITDGNPTGTGVGDATGPDQEQQIRSQFIPQFCQRGIPVSAFGLEIDTHSADGQDANRLLTDITSGTNATYTDVTSPEQLSNVVISLYAQWQNLSFTQEKPQGGNYYVSIDNLTQQATIVTFRTNSSYAITLTDPNGQRIGSPLDIDNHYEIDNLDTGGALLPGNYTVNVSADPHAQVYKLIKSSIDLRLLSPTNSTSADANQPVLIQAEFLSGTAALTPKPGDGQIIATVTLLVNGQQVSSNGSNVVELVQQSNSPVFSGKTIVFHQSGQLHIELNATYQQSQLQTSFNLSLLPPPPALCSLSCQIQQRQGLLIGIGVGVVILIIAILVSVWLLRHGRRPRLEGYITNGRPPGGELNLTELKMTRITSIDLETKGNFNFSDARFELLQQRAGNTLIRISKDNAGKVSLDGEKAGTRVDITNAGIEIKPGQKIYINGKQEASASYEFTAGRRWAK